MIQTSKTFEDILKNPYSLRYRIDIAGHSIGNESIVKLKISQDMFSEEAPSIGNACAAMLELEVLAPDFDIPPTEEIELFMQAYDSDNESEWVQRGRFYVDTRKRNYIQNNVATTLEITGYDAMMKSEALFPVSGDWPKPDTQVFQTICDTMGVSGSASLAGNPIGADIDGYTCREALRYIGALNGGNWMIDGSGTLKLVKLGHSTGTSQIIPSDLSMDILLPGISRVALHDMHGGKYQSGGSGRILNGDSLWATQAAADRVLAAVSGYRYKPFQAVEAICDPRLELCDFATYGIAYKMNLELLDQIVGMVSAPEVEEVNHDYPFVSGAAGMAGRALAEAKKSGWDHKELVAEVGAVKAGIEADVVKYGDMKDANWVYANTSVFANAEGKRAALDIWVEGESGGKLTSGASLVADTINLTSSVYDEDGDEKLASKLELTAVEDRASAALSAAMDGVDSRVNLAVEKSDDAITATAALSAEVGGVAARLDLKAEKDVVDGHTTTIAAIEADVTDISNNLNVGGRIYALGDSSGIGTTGSVHAGGGMYTTDLTVTGGEIVVGAYRYEGKDITSTDGEQHTVLGYE